jgi:TP901 family phage tail tape measure protein
VALRTVGVKLIADVTGFTSPINKAQDSVKTLHKGLAEKAKLAVDAKGFKSEIQYARKPVLQLRKDMSTKAKLVADATAFKREIQSAKQTVQSFHKELADKAPSGKLDALADKAGVMGLGLAAGFGYAVKAAAEFDKEMSAVSAATHAGAGDMARLRAAALQAGKDTQYSATEAAKGVTELSKAGIETADILGGGLKGALSLAAAGQLDVGEAAETAASAMTQFRLKGDKVPHVADLLAAAAGKAQGSVHDMGYALNQSGLVASQFGLSIEDTTGALAEFAHAGLTGSDAGTSFKTMLLALANPSGVTAKKMQELGISFYDAQGRFIGLGGVANELRDKLGSLTEQERNAALGQIFGNDAIRAAAILYKDGAKGVEEWKNKVNDAGYASVTAAKLTDNLSGDVERLKGSLETMAIEGGSGANSGLRVLTKSLGALVDQFGSINPAVSGTLVVLAGLGAALLLGSAAWVRYRRAVAEAQAQLIATGPAGEKAAGALGKLTALAGKIGLWTVALEAGATALNSINSKDADVDKLTGSLQKLMETGKIAGELKADFGNNFKDLGKVATFADEANHGFGKFINTTVAGIPIIGDAGVALGNFVSRLAFGTDAKSAQQNMASLDTAMTNFMTATGDAKQSSELWNRVLRQSGMDTDKLAELLPNAYKKLGELNSASTKSTTALDGLAGAADSASGKFMALSRQIDSLFQEQMTADRAALKLAQSTNDLSEELLKGARTLNVNTAEGRKNRSAVLDQLEAIEAVRDARVRGGMAIDVATGKYQKDIDGLKKSMRQAGFSKKAVDALTDSYRELAGSGSVNTHVTLTGDVVAGRKLNELSVMQQALKKGGALPAPLRRAFAFAEGGWTGPGSKYEPAGVVHADEFVIRKDSRQKIERSNPGLLNRMNETGEVTPGYAAGGMVWPFPVNAAVTRIPSAREAANAVTPAGPSGGGQTYKWIEAVVRAAFPGLPAISGFRPGAVTLTGHRSYHAVGRAVDFPASHALAQWVNAHYFSRTKELITPWNDLNIWNGRRHTYTGAVWNQHNFAGGNAHDHWAMANGGVITEPVFGVGKSGRTYSFGEVGPETVVPGYARGGLVSVAPSAATTSAVGYRTATADALISASGRVADLTASLKQNGRAWSIATARGRENRSALLAGIKAAQDAAQAKYAETGSVRAANAVYDLYVRRLNTVMAKQKIAGRVRRDLLRSYSERPNYDTATAAPADSSAAISRVNGLMGAQEALGSIRQAYAWTRPTFAIKTEAGRAELKELFSYLEAAATAAQSTFDATGSAKAATSIYNGFIGQLRALLASKGLAKARIDRIISTYGRITLKPTSNRWGGVYEHAASGVLNTATIAPGGTQYAWAEPSTGGELFAPKYGNLAKTRSQVGWAVENWWGGKVAWSQEAGRASHRGAGRFVVNATIPITLGAETITRQVRFEVDAAVGQIAHATIYQTA